VARLFRQRKVKGIEYPDGMGKAWFLRHVSNVNLGREELLPTFVPAARLLYNEYSFDMHSDVGR
jgi:hypothetical protein